MSKAGVANLLEQGRALQVGIGRIASADKDSALLHHFKGVEADLNRHVDRTTQLVKTLELLSTHGLVGGKDVIARTKVAGLHKKIATLQKRLKEERSQLMAQNTWASCDKEAGELGDALEARLRAAWAGFVTERTQKTESFAHFRQLEGCAEVLSEIEQIGISLRASVADLPRDESDIRKVEKASARIDALIAKLDLGDVPSAVQAFLKKASQNGVPLTEMSDEIIAWLRKKKLVAGLRVTTARGATDRFR